MSKNSLANVRGKGLSEHKHPALHHELGDTYTPQKRRFAALIGSRDNDQVPGIRMSIIADHSLLLAQSQEGVSQSNEGMPPFSGGCRIRKRQRDAFLLQTFVQMQTTDIEG
jgi:hypothetical protein